MCTLGLIDAVISTKVSATGGLHEVASIAVGAHIMVTVNIDASDGIANVVCDTVIARDHSGSDVHAILVKFDSDRIWREASTNRRILELFPSNDKRSNFTMAEQNFRTSHASTISTHTCMGLHYT